MFIKTLVLTSLVLVFSACTLQADVINSIWDGGDEGFWRDAKNWEPKIVPDTGQTFRVTIRTLDLPGDDEYEVTLRENRTIDRLDIYGEVQLQRRVLEDPCSMVLAIEEDLDLTLTILDPNNGLTNHGVLESEVIIQGNVFNQSDACMKGGFDICDGNLVNHYRGRLEGDDNIDVHDANIFNYGVAAYEGSGGGLWAARRLENHGLLQLHGATCGCEETFANEETGTIKGWGTIDSPYLISNAGHIQSLGGYLVLRSLSDFDQEPSTNHGLVNTGTITNGPGANVTVMVSTEDSRNNGALVVQAGGAIVFDCNLVNEPDAVVQLLGGTLAATTITQKAGATFQGFGGITGDIIIEPNAVIKLTGPTNIIGNLTIEEDATLDISDGTVLITGDVTCNNGIIQTTTNGTIIIQGEMKGVCQRIFIDVVGTNNGPNE